MCYLLQTYKNYKPIFGASESLPRKGRKEAEIFLKEFQKAIKVSRDHDFTGHLSFFTSLHFGYHWFTPVSRIEDCLHLYRFSWAWRKDIVSNTDCVEFRFDDQFFDKSFDLVQFLGICFQTPDNKHTQQKQPSDFISLPPREAINPALSSHLESKTQSESQIVSQTWICWICIRALNFLTCCLFTQMKQLFLDFWWNWWNETQIQ